MHCPAGVKKTILLYLLLIILTSTTFAGDENPQFTAIKSDVNREWADAMLKVREEFRNSASKEPDQGKKTLTPSLTSRIFGQMLEDYPYRTDWMLQDNGNDLEAWLNQRGDPIIEKTLLRKFQGLAEIFEALKKNFQSLEKAGVGTDDRRWLMHYAQACEARRVQRLENLKRKYPRIVFTKNHTLQPSFFAYTEGQSDAQAGRSYVPESALCVMTWEGAYAQVIDLINDPHGRIRDPEVSFDGKKILFAWKKSNRLDDYHLYEIDIATGKVRQLTFGLGVADFEPCYLPNGDIVFSSSRCVQTVDCFWTEVSNLYTCGPNGEYLRRLGFDQVHTVKPSLLEDGRVIYTRWDYNDRGQIYPQGLFQMNPDGTGQTEFYGNNSWFPTTICHARGIPGNSQVIAVAHGHHTWQAGELILIDIAKGRQEAQGIQLIAPIRQTKSVRVDKYGQEGDLFQYPYPLNEREYLVAYSPLGGRPTRFSIYYMDIDGNRELLVSAPDISCQHPVLLAERKRPAARPSTVDYTKATGTYYMQDIYVGPGLEGVPRGTIKKLRVVALEFRVAGIGQNGSRGPAGGALASTPISIGNGSWDVKRVIGDSTVYSDGSAFFEAPAQTPLYFQALDKQNRAVQTMRSWSTLMPGENASCVGCHEDKNSAPLPRKTSMAMKAGVQKLEPFYGPPRGFSFLKEIQPIFDSKCVSCHDGEKKNKKTGKPIFSLKDTEVLDKTAKRRWTESYLNLTMPVGYSNENGGLRGDASGGACVWVSTQSVPSMIRPYSVGSAISPMINKLLVGHGDVKLTQEELEKIACWIDLGVPFCGDYYEANAWSAEERAKYDRYQAKRERFAALSEDNKESMLAGEVVKPSNYDQNTYRNIALEARATANSECRNEEQFFACNVIDGRRENKGHGKQFPSWGPDKLDDLWLKLEWKEDVFIDRINIYVRADFQPYKQKDHDSWWKSGKIELSNGRKISFRLKKRADVQVIEIPIKKWPPEAIRWLKFSDLVPAEDKWCGFTEVEVMGCNDEKLYK
jgi:hypothetical protein